MSTRETAGQNILDAFGRVATSSPTNRYEGAWFSQARSVLPGLITSARKEITRSTRRQILRNSRYLFKNSPLTRATVTRFVTYTVGNGILIEPDSSNSEWNKRASEIYRERCENICLDNRMCRAQMQAIKLTSAIIDGDCFDLLTYNQFGRPAVQLIEAHEIGSPETSRPDSSDDGVECDKYGMPSAYLMPQDGGDMRRLDAEYVVPLANIERPGQHRGICLFASAITTAIDLHEIIGFEKVGVKVGGSKTDIITAKLGEVTAEGLVRGTSSDGSAAYYKNEFPEARIIKPGDSYEQFVNQRPSPAWTGFVDFLAELVCLSLGLPVSMVRQIKVGGADTRRDLATAQRVVEFWQMLIAKGEQRVYEHIIGAEIEDGALANPPADWRRTVAQYPRAMTVDAGRTSQQDREDIRTGNMTLSEGCGQYGADWRQHIAQLAREAKEIERVERDNNLPAGSLARRLYGDDGRDATVRAQLDAYGVAVRAGSITPNIEDERALRSKMGLPVASKDVERVWSEDGGARKPITIQSQETQNTANAATAANENHPQQ